jgi:hypothetical protein
MHCISLGHTLKVIVKRQFIAKMCPEFIYLKCRDKALLFVLKGKNVFIVVKVLRTLSSVESCTPCFLGAAT